VKYLPLVLKHLRRNWVRTLSTITAMALCIFLFCTLRTLIDAVTWSLNTAQDSRLVSRNAVSLMFPLPVSAAPKIAAVPGVRSVAKMHFFGGTRRPNDMSDFFVNFAVEAEPFLEMFPEIVISPEQKRAFLEDTRGCIIGRRTAARFGWKIGDMFQLVSPNPNLQMGRPFEFVIRGIFDSDEVHYNGTDTSVMYFHFKYLYESTQQRSAVGNYAIKIDDPSRAGAIGQAIDAMFENSDTQTHTETEAAFRAGLVSAAGNLAPLLNSIALVVIITILLVTANTMAMAIRERRTEIAVLKTLGFSSRLVMGLVLAESLALALTGGVGGALAGRAMIHALPTLPLVGDAVRNFPRLDLSPTVAATAVALTMALGLGAGLLPALAAYRTSITDALRQV
jgi:putative ABC transport system permease protein